MNAKGKKLIRRKPAVILVLLVICFLAMVKGNTVYATTVKDTVTNSTNDNKKDNHVSGALGPLEFTLNTDEDANSLSSSLQMLMVLTVISLAPSILIMVTSFTRIVIVLHFVRSALGLQTTPPNQIIVGLSLFLTFFIMSPVITKVNTEAIQPLAKGTISQEEAWDAGIAPVRTFMLEQVRTKDLKLFIDIAKVDTSEMKSLDELPITVIIPAFIISELQYAFIIGFLIYIPFIVIDMVVASTLMSMGMMMLPPTTISTPFKILLFIMADGWNLVIGQLVKTFYN